MFLRLFLSQKNDLTLKYDEYLLFFYENADQITQNIIKGYVALGIYIENF